MLQHYKYNTKCQTCNQHITVHSAFDTKKLRLYNITCKYVLAIVTGLKWQTWFMFLKKSMKYFSGSTILQRTTKKPLYLTMTACAVSSSVGNIAFIPILGLIFCFGQCQGEICSKAFVWNNVCILRSILCTEISTPCG